MADAYVYFIGALPERLEALGTTGHLGSLNEFFVSFTPFALPHLTGSTLHQDEGSRSALTWSFSTDELVTEDPLTNIAHAILVYDTARRIAVDTAAHLVVGNGGLQSDMLPDSELSLSTAAFAFPVQRAYAPNQIYFDRTFIALDFWTRITFFNPLNRMPRSSVRIEDITTLERMLVDSQRRLLEARLRAEHSTEDDRPSQ